MQCFVAFCLFMGVTSNAQIVVTNTNNSGAGSLRQAVADANAGEIITFGPLVLTAVELDSEITINKNLTITGGNGTINIVPTTISGDESTRIFMITNNAEVIVNNVIFTDGMAAQSGGAISAMSGTTLTLNNCTVRDSEAMGNDAAQGGGGIYTMGTLNLNGCLITNNEASGTSGSGGGVLIGTGGNMVAGTGNDALSTPTMISDNTASRAGGGIEGNSGANTTITLNGVQLVNNETGSNPGNGAGLHVTGAGNTEINNCTVTGNEAASEGGGLWNGTGTMTITDTTIEDNEAMGNDATNGGGGIYNLNNGTLIIRGCIINNNHATGTSGSGGGIFSDISSTLLVETSESQTQSVISNNTANRAGGGVEYNTAITEPGSIIGSATFNNVNFTGNSILTANPGNGGAYHITGPGTTNFSGGTISGNMAVQGGGLWNASGTMVLESITITDNEATGNAAPGTTASGDGGGGIYNVNGSVAISDTSFITQNRATGTAGSGGGIFSGGGNITVNNSNIENNSANRAGGGIEIITGTYILNNTMVTGNDVNGTAGTPAPGNGGGVHITGPLTDTTPVPVTTFTINGGRIDSNIAAREGGGLWNNSNATMIVDGVTMDGNTANGNSGDDGGGAIFNNNGTLMVTASTLSDNSAEGTSGRGGAIHINQGTATIMRSTISGNSANNFGGGIYNNGTLTVNAATIAFNDSGESGGGIYSNSNASMKNTIVAENQAETSGVNLFSSSETTISSEGYNFIAIDDTGALQFTEEDQKGTVELPLNAFLLPLASYENSVNEVHSFSCPSPVADRGDAEENETDQLGQEIFNNRRDIGAFEKQEICSELSVNNVIIAGKSSVYPNPSGTGMFNLQLHNNIADGSAVKVYEISTGKLIRQAVTTGMEMQLDLSDFSTGMYIMQITSGKTTENHKIMIGR